MNKDKRLETRLREDFDAAPVPGSLAPDRLETMLDKKTRKTPASAWVIRIASVAAALALIAGAALALRQYSGRLAPASPADLLPVSSGSPEDYGEIYSAIKKNNRLYEWRLYLQSSAKGAESSVNAHVPEQSAGEPDDFSGTNVQVEGVDEADYVKTDGRYIYVVSDSTLRIFDVASRRVAGSCSVADGANLIDMYLIDGRVSIVFSKTRELKEDGYGYYKAETGVLTVDVTDPASPKIISEKLQSGSYVTSRAIGGSVYLVTQYGVWYVPASKDAIESYIPYVREGGAVECLPAESITVAEDGDSPNEFVLITAYDARTGGITDSKSMFGCGFDVYCALGRLYVYSTYYARPVEAAMWTSGTAYTSISCFGIEDGKITAGASASLIGTANDQFSFHYQGGYLYVCTTFTQDVAQLPAELRAKFPESKTVDSNGIFALDGELKIADSIKNLGLGETIRSARYVGNMCYFVTFLQTDPLFAVDISDPRALRLESELKVPGFSTYLHPYSDGLLLGFGYDADEEGRTTGLKLSMFDVSDPARTAEISRLVIGAGHGAYSEALYNHKAIYVNAEKRLVGLPLTLYGDQGESVCYRLYRFSENGYEQVCELGLPARGAQGYYFRDYFFYRYSFGARGLHIGGAFYCVTADGVTAVSLEDFSPLFTVSF